MPTARGDTRRDGDGPRVVGPELEERASRPTGAQQVHGDEREGRRGAVGGGHVGPGATDEHGDGDGHRGHRDQQDDGVEPGHVRHHHRRGEGPAADGDGHDEAEPVRDSPAPVDGKGGGQLVGGVVEGQGHRRGQSGEGDDPDHGRCGELGGPQQADQQGHPGDGADDRQPRDQAGGRPHPRRGDGAASNGEHGHGTWLSPVPPGVRPQSRTHSCRTMPTTTVAHPMRRSFVGERATGCPRRRRHAGGGRRR